MRRFNREVTRRLGVITSSFLGRGRPLGEARLIYEIGLKGARLRDLRERLSLDPRHLGRSLKSLQRQGLIRCCKAPSDARLTRANLTAAGATELRTLNRLSDAYAMGLLTTLSEQQRMALVGAMSEVESLMRAASVKISLAAPTSPLARFCLDAYFRELNGRFFNGFDPGKSISANPAELTPPAGFLFLATLDGLPVGCGALKVGDSRVGEIKRMWVAPSARGLGIGQRLLQALQGQARKVRLRTLRLETNESLKEAQQLYRRSGFSEVAPFNNEPYAHHWFEKSILRPQAQRSASPVARRRALRTRKDFKT